MDNHLHNLNGHQKFLREFINLYRTQECLWNKNHPNYKNRSDRGEAYEILLKKCREYLPEADEDYVRLRIDSMRSSFRKEHKKVLNSQAQNTDSKSVYKPSLWYYELLLFTTGEVHDEQDNSITSENNIEVNPEEYNAVRIPFWGREYSSLVINLYKKHTCLYALNDPNYKSKHKRIEAIKNITEELKAKTGKTFFEDDVRRKIHLLRGQFMYEFRKIEKHRQAGKDVSSYQPSLWCFNLLFFLRTHIVKMESMLKRKDGKQNQGGRKRIKLSSGNITSDQDYNNVEVLKQEQESDSGDNDHDIYEETADNIDKDSVDQPDTSQADMSENGLNIRESDDMYDTIGKVMAKRLRDMTTEQNGIALKLIHDLMYHGQMENLTSNSKLVL